MTLTAFAAAAGVSTQTIRRRIADGQLRAIRIGGHIFLDSSELPKVLAPVPINPTPAA